MSRDEAHEIVKPYIFNYYQYKVVSYNDLGKLIGDKLDIFTNDIIRCKGPDKNRNYYYYWNIIDYVMI